MKIKGLQKLTLLDYPGKMACTVFTWGCNFRCPFCHNASLVTKNDGEFITEEVFFDFLKKRQGILQAVCITGGEPTLMPDLEEFIIKIKEMGFLVKLDTNGYNPKKLKELVEKKLIDYVAMDIKNCKEKYGLTAGIKNFNTAPIEESVDFLMSGNIPYEFRTTVVKELHTKEDIEKLTLWIQGAQNYYLQGFTDSGDLIENNYTGYSKGEMEEILKVARKALNNATLRGF